MARRLQQAVHRGRATARGPVWTGQTVTVEVSDDDEGVTYRVQWLPDVNNSELRDAGQPMHFYYLPERPRLTRNPDGSYVFHLQRFSGVMDPTRNIGEDGYSELAGGALSFSFTLGLPERVLERAFETLKAQLSEHQNRPLLFWRPGANRPEPVRAGPVALHENEVVLHSLRPGDAQGGGSGAGPEPWAFEIQGMDEGGSLNVEASNAYTVMLGSRPVQMLMASAESGTSQITVENRISYYVWSMVTKIEVSGRWESVYDHLSAHLRGSWGPFNPLDLKAVTDDIVQKSDVTVRVSFGEGMVDASEREPYRAAADAIANSFRKMIETRLGEAMSAHTDDEHSEATAEDPVQRPGGWLRRLFGSPKPALSLALESRRQAFSGSFSETHEINGQMLRNDVVNSQMQGVFDELKADRGAWDRYFSEVFFEEGFRKLHVVARANAHWGNGAPGDPIHTLNLQVGYPDSEGNLQWKSAARFKESDAETTFSEVPSPVSWTKATRDRLYAFDFTRHERAGAPSEQVRLRQTVRFVESPDVAVQEIEVDEETEDHIVEVRANAAGNLRVGPIGIDMPIGPDDTQIQVDVRVRTRTFGERVYRFDHTTVADPPVFSVWYASPSDVEPYEYKVEVVVQGRRFGQSALRWEGPWTRRRGSGPLMAEVPPVPEELEETIDAYLSAD